MKVIDLSVHVEHEGTQWIAGTFGCAACGETQASVVAFPSWACGPPALECGSCGEVACLAVSDPASVGPWVAPGMPGGESEVDPS